MNYGIVQSCYDLGDELLILVGQGCIFARCAVQQHMKCGLLEEPHGYSASNEKQPDNCDTASACQGKDSDDSHDDWGLAGWV